MATGDQSDIKARISALIPSRWFGDSHPIVDALVMGGAYLLAGTYSMIMYVRNQTRISTASDGWLDLIAGDFFGTDLIRRAGQSDASFRALILSRLLREKTTRAGIVATLQTLTGNTPKVIELLRPADTGSYGGPLCGYGVAGAYGSMSMPYQAFIQIARPTGQGIPNVIGYGNSPGGYSTPSQIEYASIANVNSAATDADIYAAVEATKPAGTAIWVQLQ